MILDSICTNLYLQASYGLDENSESSKVVVLFSYSPSPSTTTTLKNSCILPSSCNSEAIGVSVVMATDGENFLINFAVLTFVFRHFLHSL